MPTIALKTFSAFIAFKHRLFLVGTTTLNEKRRNILNTIPLVSKNVTTMDDNNTTNTYCKRHFNALRTLLPLFPNENLPKTHQNVKKREQIRSRTTDYNNWNNNVSNNFIFFLLLCFLFLFSVLKEKKKHENKI